MILTPLQEEAMDKIRTVQERFESVRWFSCYEVTVHRNTLRALESKGLIENYKDENDDGTMTRETIYYRMK